jgi:hypothetical protein
MPGLRQSAAVARDGMPFVFHLVACSYADLTNTLRWPVIVRTMP